MIRDPERRGRAAADLHAELAPRLWDQLEEAGLLPAGAGPGARARARLEWECFALYACVRALVAAGGFNRETAAAIDALHAAALADRTPGAAQRRRLVSDRYAEYGAIGQAGGRAGAETVTRRLGEAAARHMTAPDEPPAELGEMVGALHESLVEGAVEALRGGADG